MNDKDKINCIKSIIFKLMYHKIHQSSNAEDAYIEHEIRLTEDEYRVAYEVFSAAIQLLNADANADHRDQNDHK